MVLEKYISEKEALVKPDAERTAISNDAFAVCEMIQHLIFKLNQILNKL